MKKVPAISPAVELPTMGQSTGRGDLDGVDHRHVIASSGGRSLWLTMSPTQLSIWKAGSRSGPDTIDPLHFLAVVRVSHSRCQLFSSLHVVAPESSRLTSNQTRVDTRGSLIVFEDVTSGAHTRPDSSRPSNVRGVEA